MSSHLYAKSGIIEKCDQEDKESIVDIYVSAESLRVFDNPWVEGAPPKVPGSVEAQHPVSLVSENSRKKSHTRTDLVFLVVVCFLLLIGIICLGVQMNKDKTYWTTETNQLSAVNADLKKTIGQLTANNTKLSNERDALRRKLCDIEKDPKTCKNLDLSECP